jgi:hypothetical protein
MKEIMSKIITLHNGSECLVDDADFEFLSQWSWQCDAKGYAVRSVHLGRIDGKWKKSTIKMHRLLTACPKQYQVDHINGIKLDNRKSNLRICTNGENQMNGGAYKTSATGYRGVSWCRKTKKWKAQIQHNKHKQYIGVYPSKEAAALAYNRKAVELFGQFARPNQIPEHLIPPPHEENPHGLTEDPTPQA